MFVPLPKRQGELQKLDGYFSKAIYYRMQTPAEVEDRVGYRTGRLREGWWLMFLIEMPNVGQFEVRGLSHMSGGIVQGHLPENQHNLNAEQQLKAAGHNLTGTSYQKVGTKQRLIQQTFRLVGAERLAKIRPVARAHGTQDIPDYPPGKAIPQWTLTTPLRWVAAAFIPPGQRYEGNYT